MTKPSHYREATRPFGPHTHGNHPEHAKRLRYDTPPQHTMHEGPGLTSHHNHANAHKPVPDHRPCGGPGIGGTNHGNCGSQRKG